MIKRTVGITASNGCIAASTFLPQPSNLPGVVCPLKELDYPLARPRKTRMGQPAVLLVPYEFKLRDPSKVNDGWDPPIKGDVHTDGSKDEDDWVPWTLVAKAANHGNFNRNELTKIVLPSNETAQMFELAVADDSTAFIEINETSPGQPIALTQAETPITIIGKNARPTLIDDATIELRSKHDHQMVGKMKVKVVPDLAALSLKFYKIEDDRSLIEDANSPYGGVRGTKVRMPDSEAGGMYADIQGRFAQTALSFSMIGNAEKKNVPFLLQVPPEETGGITYGYHFDTQDRNRAQLLLQEAGCTGGHLRIALVHLLKQGSLGEYFPESDICLMSMDSYYLTLFNGLPDAPWNAYDDEVFDAEDAHGYWRGAPRVASHEIGHQFILSTRGGLPSDDLPVPGYDGGHDYGPYPKDTASIMRAGQKPGRWLRHEDWDKAVSEASVRLTHQ